MARAAESAGVGDYAYVRGLVVVVVVLGGELAEALAI